MMLRVRSILTFYTSVHCHPDAAFGLPATAGMADIINAWHRRVNFRDKLYAFQLAHELIKQRRFQIFFHVTAFLLRRQQVILVEQGIFLLF